MKASVIILTKNPGSIFKSVLSAVLEQKTPWEYEVLIIDSGSTDGTVEYVKAIKEVRLQQILPQDFGHGVTRNFAVSLTSGEFAVMLTHDALPASTSWLVELVSAADQLDIVAGAFGRHLAYSNDGPFLERDLNNHFDGFLNNSSVVSLEDERRYKDDIGYRQKLHFFSDNNACLRRSVWEKIPYPDVDFAEDQLWAKMVIEEGYSKAYADKAAVYHPHSFCSVELFRRSFDESRALMNLFGYKLCPSLPYMFMRSFYASVYDFVCLLKKKSALTEWIWVLRSPFQNLSKQMGFYVGQRSEKLPTWFVEWISRDMSLRRKGI